LQRKITLIRCLKHKMKNLFTILLLLFGSRSASATPVILIQAEEIQAILSEFSTLSLGSALLSSVKLIKDSSPRTYEIETRGIDKSEPICKIHGQAEFVKVDPTCLPPPGGRCDGEYVVRIVNKACN
jgi:hypothetical protein